MTNKEYILKISALNKQDRIDKILSCITKNYIMQTVNPSSRSFHTATKLTNIIIPAKDQKNKTVVMGHWDVYPESYGYNDNSTGVVTLLKLQHVVRDNVELVFTDGEECGGQGCRYYLENYPKPKEAINVDVVGLGDKIFFEMYGDCSFVMSSDVTMYQGVPFSDSYVLADYGVPNILLLTGKHKHALIEDIFHAEHCGRDDGKIDLISEGVMDRVFGVLAQMVGK
jgi:hypothetical protein